MSVQQIARRGLMSAARRGTLGFIPGTYTNGDGEIKAMTATTMHFVKIQRSFPVTIPLTEIPAITSDDTVEITFTLQSGSEISGRYDCTFGGLLVINQKTVSDWASLTTTVTASANASTAEFVIIKRNTGDYAPTNPPDVQISVSVNGTVIM